MSAHGQQQQQAPLGQGGGAGSVHSDVVLPDMAMMMVPLREIDFAAQIDVEEERIMPPDEVRSCWEKIFNRWNINDDEIIRLATVAVLRYFVVNGSSPRAPFDRDIRVRGRKYPMRIVKGVLQRNVRRFCRAHADVVRNIMRSDEEFAAKIGARLGMYEHYHLAFDFADACTGLTQPEREVVSKVKRCIIRRTTPYSAFVDTTTPNVLSNSGSTAALAHADNGGGVQGGYY